MKRFSKLKKAAAAILGAALMLTSLSVPAFATETADPVIDTTKKGSITINKYEGQKDDTSKPLEGVEFTIYQIGEFEQTTGNQTVLNLKSLVKGIDKIDSTTTYESIKEEIDTAIHNDKLSPATDPKKTALNEDSTKASVTFNNLALGVYLVVETDAPPQVVDRSANFLVSVPMMNTEGTGWNYNIEANPKNQAVYGGINLIKRGTGKALLQGVTFTLQRQKNTNTWETVGTHKTDQNGSLNVQNLAPGTYRFIETDLGDNPGYILDGKTAYEFNVDEQGKIVIGKEQATDKGMITVINEKPDMTKQVQKKDSRQWGQDADYNVGDKVPYKITVDVPKNITDLETFTITDTPTNLKDDINSVKVKSGENLIKNDNSIYEVTQTSDGNGFTIEFRPSAMSDYAGKRLTIEYQAELLENADTTTKGNPNTAKLEYSNMIKPDQGDTDNPNKDKTPGKNTIEDNAVVYTFKINVHKQDENSKTLQGVTFDLYKEVEEGIPDAEKGNKKNGLSPDKYWLKLRSNLKTNDQGDISVSGLANGDYYLVETKTVNGYNLLKEPVKVTLKIQYKTSITETQEWEDDVANNGKKLVKHTITSTDTTFTGGDTTSSNEGYVTQTVINKKGFTLPTTGGMGTVLFGVGGAALALAGLYMILSSRKKTSK
nr:SpaH/EbpB family LPXTG-anchored major pilin [uncultured Blautia sp.]